jgi:shikimate dehydrogenase
VLTAETRLVGLIGDPVSHSLSPRMQNAAFAARGLDWAYVPLPVKSERLEEAVRGLVGLGFAGVNVTIPHKTAVLSFCDELDAVAERAGSVNTIVVDDDRVLGSSTDGLAVVSLVEAGGASVLLLGAGGAAQAAATALLDAGASALAVAARDAERAHALSSRLRTLFPEREIAADEWPLERAGASVRLASRRDEGAWPPETRDATLVVNATPVSDRPLVPATAKQQVVDLAYRADGRTTALVAAAKEAGCARVIDGIDVLVAQGAASFERWTGIEAPAEVMRAAVRSLPA